jgi:hypothetical protein
VKGNFLNGLAWSSLLGGIGWGAIWVGVGVMLLGMGGCGFLVFHGDSPNSPPLVSIHIHLK